MTAYTFTFIFMGYRSTVNAKFHVFHIYLEHHVCVCVCGGVFTYDHKFWLKEKDHGCKLQKLEKGWLASPWSWTQIHYNFNSGRFYTSYRAEVLVDTVERLSLSGGLGTRLKDFDNIIL